MCGIAGIIGLKNDSKIAPDQVVAMCDRISHRGPDGEGYLFSQHVSQNYLNYLRDKRPTALVARTTLSRPVALGHRRLSIIDLASNAAQPMADIHNNYWIVFNGEIYNHRELRCELEDLGYIFQTSHSDTEVIIQAYAAWGKQCLERFRGMFAFVLIDIRNDTILMVRDRLGIKPIFFAIANQRIIFASEMKSILIDPSISKKLCSYAINDYFTFLAVAAPNTIFRDIKKIPPGHYIQIKQGYVSDFVQYWDPLETEVIANTEKNVIERLFFELETSVKYRMEADVDYGALLSGGVDSSANLFMLSRQKEKPIKSFAIGFDNSFPGYRNEFEYSRIVAQQLNSEYIEIKLSLDEFNEALPKMVYYQDEPIADTANIPIYIISKVARENGVPILLGGEGSDELLIGYSHWTLAYKFHNTFKKKNTFLKPKLAQWLHNFPIIRNKRPIYRNWYPKLLNGQTIFWGGTEIETEMYKKFMLSEELAEQTGDYSSYQVIENFYNKFKMSGRTNYLDWMSYIDLSYRLPELLLARLDRMTMAASVEGRVPFMDHLFVEFCMSIPAELKIKNSTEKYLLKKAFEGSLPDVILYRPKLGFPVPLDSILFNEKFLTNSNKAILDFNKTNNIFSEQYLSHLFKRGSGREYWNALNLSLWYNSI